MNLSEANPSVAGGTGQSRQLVVATSSVPEIAHKTAVAREVGALLIVSGIAGIILPGPVGTPLLILGCVMIWPAAFTRIERFFEKRFPRTHRLGAFQTARFLSDLDRRYPDTR